MDLWLPGWAYCIGPGKLPGVCMGLCCEVLDVLLSVASGMGAATLLQPSCGCSHNCTCAFTSQAASMAGEAVWCHSSLMHEQGLPGLLTRTQWLLSCLLQSSPGWEGKRNTNPE